MSSKTQPLKFDTPVQYVKGVGPKLAKVFEKAGLYTVKDLVYFLPRTYQSNRFLRDFSQIQPGENIFCLAKIVKKKQVSLRRGKVFYEVIVTDGARFVTCKFFRSPYQGWFSSLKIESTIEVRGSARLYKGRLEFHHPQIFPYQEEKLEEKDNLTPIYRETGDISQTKIRKIIHYVLDNMDYEKDFLPAWIKTKYNLISHQASLQGIHQPDASMPDKYLSFKTKPQKRFIFDEFFELQFYLASKKKSWRDSEAQKIPIDASMLATCKDKLPFDLTEAQERSLKEIFADFDKNTPMYRMLQGDVGSGKTLVALIASLACAKAGVQTAIMVPTEVLAEQHYKNALAFFKDMGVQVEKLTGKVKTSEKNRILKSLSEGSCHVCIGTQALIQDNIRFHQLGLVVIDEQHRFGAHQRSLLKLKGKHPHFLIMTATPIPRTLSLSLYGDLDISLIDELPKGRGEIVTRKTTSKKRREVFDFLKQQVEQGRQAYVVYPLIEENEDLDIENATEQCEFLQKTYPNISFHLLTGRMKPEEKLDIMHRFRQGEIQVLVSTTVIEVGIDVPNATLMIIENAERFGLSQMHQLRGRVGRGQHKSYCVILLSEHSSILAKERAGIMETYRDGFQLAEKDLELRGPGELLGSRQSGSINFKMACLIRDIDLLILAKKASEELFLQDAELEQEKHQKLKIRFQKSFKTISPG